MKAYQDYQRKKQLDGPWCVEGDTDPCQQAVVIPSLGEGQQLWATLTSLASNPADSLQHCLVVVVINCRPDCNADLVEQNKQDLNELRQGRSFGALRLAWVDATTQGRELPLKLGGVGMARKIGSDLTLPCLCRGGHLIHLDADTLVDENYMSAIAQSFQGAAFGGAVIPYCHQMGNDPVQHQAITLYELYMRTHVVGLQHAGSPYGYHTIGSTMVSTREAYIKAGGMNCRLAGEDFYFMQQLAKTSGVGQVHGTVVAPDSRISQRTPFGTGQVILELSSDSAVSQRFYAPQCYRVLQQWLTLVKREQQADADDLLFQAGEICSELQDFLQQEKFAATWQRISASHKDVTRRQRAFHEWFDGLKTMRLIHYLSDQVYPVGEATEHVPPLLRQLSIDSGTTAEHWLATLRQQMS
ncbi:MAG: hypothetical protein JRG71_08590 [Deltaproteobacteria bacterium]|nr:hypothetical protein [Deltaproteobacteria bacterium]